MQDADNEKFMDEWGEQGTYHPTGGTPRSIMLIVNRDVPDSIPESPAGGMGQVITVNALNRKTAIADDDYGGIGSDEVDTGGDKVTLPLRIDQTPKQRPIVAVLEQDGGMMKLQVK